MKLIFSLLFLVTTSALAGQAQGQLQVSARVLSIVKQKVNGTCEINREDNIGHIKIHAVARSKEGAMLTFHISSKLQEEQYLLNYQELEVGKTHFLAKLTPQATTFDVEILVLNPPEKLCQSGSNFSLGIE